MAANSKTAPVETANLDAAKPTRGAKAKAARLAISTLVREALIAANAYDIRCAAISAAVKAKPRNVAENIIMEDVADFYNVNLRAKQKGHGQTWDLDSEKWATAKKAYERMVAAVFGPAPKAAKPELEVSEKLAKLAALFFAAAEADAAEQGLKGSTRLIATALAQARNA